MSIQALANPAFLLGFLLGTASAQMTTSQYDNGRTGAYLHERQLTPKNVNQKQFGKVGELHVDGDVYAQPLYWPKLAVSGKGIHDVVFVATAGDSVYAFDASGKTTLPLWHVEFTNAAGITTVSSSDEEADCDFIKPQVGITSTPVIDATTETLYVLVRTKERDSAGITHFRQRLHALDAHTGNEKFGGPVAIKASVNGPTSLFGLMHETVEFNPLRENPRAGLALVNGQLVLTWGSSCDIGPYHGWILTYDPHTLKQTGVFNTSPDTADSGIWQADAAPAADSQGNIFVLTGNGVFTAAHGGRDYGDSVLKLAISKNGIILRDSFTPFNEEQLSRNDLDLGSGGPIVVPLQADSKERLLIAGGKSGTIYVLNRDHLGDHRPKDDDQVLQTFQCGGGSYGAPAYWNGHVYYLCSGDVLKDFLVKGARLSLTAAANPAIPFAGLGATPTISADGAQNGIVWAVECHGPHTSVAVLHAYNAADIMMELYNSNQRSRDYAGRAIRFTIPTVADGRVYVGTTGEVDIYGLLQEPKNVR